MDDISDRNSAELLRSIKSSATEYDSQSRKVGKEQAGHDRNGSNESIALRLLQSPDSRIAAAAKRIFESSASSPAISEISSATTFSLATPGGPNQPEEVHSNAHASVLKLADSRKNDAILGILAATASELDSHIVSSRDTNDLRKLDTDMKLFPSNQRHIDHQNGDSPAATDPLQIEGKIREAKQTEPRNKLKLTSRPTNMTSKDRLHRSRERNRMHARKTRQRKKEHMQNLQDEAKSLKNEQIRLKLQINEKNTANILLVMCNNTYGGDQNQHCNVRTNPPDPQVEKLMQRDTKDIPDSSRVMELPALVLPGQHKKKVSIFPTSTNVNISIPSTTPKQSIDSALAKVSMDNNESMSLNEHKLSLQNYNEELMEGIDYNLLCRDRSTCTPAELNLIRKERNRMHAKRTRDRKRIFMEEMKLIIEQLRNENKVLTDYMNSLNSIKSTNTPLLSSPTTPDSSIAPSQMAPIPPISLDSQPTQTGKGQNTAVHESIRNAKT